MNIFPAGDSCSSNKSDQQWWESGSKKDCYLPSMDDLSQPLRHKRGDDGRGRLLWMKRMRKNLRERRRFIIRGI